MKFSTDAGARLGNTVTGCGGQRTVDAEAAVIWACREQQAHRYLGYESNLGRGGGGGFAFEALGVKVQGSGVAGMLAGDQVPVDADIIVAQAAPLAHGLLILYGQTGERPPWAAAPWIEIKDRSEHWARVPPPVHFGVVVAKDAEGAARCPISIFNGPGTAALLRDDYTLWWRGLVELAGRLEGKLESRVVVAPQAPAEPWAAARRATPPVGCRLELSAAQRRGIVAAGVAGEKRAVTAARFGLTVDQVRNIQRIRN